MGFVFLGFFDSTVFLGCEFPKRGRHHDSSNADDNMAEILDAETMTEPSSRLSPNNAGEMLRLPRPSFIIEDMIARSLFGHHLKDEFTERLNVGEIEEEQLTNSPWKKTRNNLGSVE